MAFEAFTWHLDRPAFNSYQASPTGELSVSYAANIDCRWGAFGVCLGPSVTTLDMSASGGTANNVNCMAHVTVMSGAATTPILAVGRGTKLGGVRLDTRVLVTDNSATAFTAAVTDLLRTLVGTTEELSVCQGGSPYDVVTAFPTTGGYTFSENDDAVINRIMQQFGSDNAVNRVFGLGTTSSAENTVRTNNLVSGTVTMDNPAWTTIDTIDTPGGFTGIGSDGRFVLIGSKEGIWYLDADAQDHRLLIPEMTSDEYAGFGIKDWSLGATFIPTSRGLRASKNLSGFTVGPENMGLFPRNDSPVFGRWGEGAGTDQWFYIPVYNPVDDDSYICAVRPIPGSLVPAFDFYPIIQFDGTECRVAHFTDKIGGVANPTVWLGNDDDVSWFIEGRTAFFPDDTNYRYALSGTLYGTKLTQYPLNGKKPLVMVIETLGCSSTETITPSIVYTDHLGDEQTVALPAIKSDGRAIIQIPSGAIEANQFYPTFAFASSSSSLTPRIWPPEVTIYCEITELKDKGGAMLPQELAKARVNR